MRPIRFLIVLFLALIPLVTLVHRNEVRRWDVNREAMSAPDEFSYLLMADNILHSHTISTTHAVGRDTFYPPGFPLLLAGWWAFVGESIFTAHALDALLLCGGTIVVFFLARLLLLRLGEVEQKHFSRSTNTAEWIAVLVTALFATNWHVLESGLFVFSEPAFMLATFAWLALALRWRQWEVNAGKTLVMASLAILAWSIRGAGIVCVAATFLYPLAQLCLQFRNPAPDKNIPRRLGMLSMIVAMSLAYQTAITLASPEKSITAGNNSDNSYPRQLMSGLTDGRRIDASNPSQWPHLLYFITMNGFSHLDDFSGNFTPWFRESPSSLFLNFIGKLIAAFALLGWIYHLLFGRSKSRSWLLELYVFLYVALYLAWPFDFFRFWSPLLPVMLVYAADAIRLFSPRTPNRTATRLTAALLLLLTFLSTEELFYQLGHYERRLNYVSDSLAGAANKVVQLSPDPRETIVAVPGDTEHFVFAWYLPRDRGFLPRSPLSHLPTPGGPRERIEDMLLRSIAEMKADPAKRLFILSYYNNDLFPNPVFANLKKEAPLLMADFKIVRVYQREAIAAAWEVQPITPANATQKAP